jgi:hypothetical protein
VVAATAFVFIGIVTLDAPAGIVTVAGRVTFGLVDETEMITALPTVPVKETVPVELAPPTTDVGFSIRFESTGANTCVDELTVCPAKVALMVTVVSA